MGKNLSIEKVYELIDEEEREGKEEQLKLLKLLQCVNNNIKLSHNDFYVNSGYHYFGIYYDHNVNRFTLSMISIGLSFDSLCEYREEFEQVNNEIDELNEVIIKFEENN